MITEDQYRLFRPEVIDRMRNPTSPFKNEAAEIVGRYERGRLQAEAYMLLDAARARAALHQMDQDYGLQPDIRR